MALCLMLAACSGGAVGDTTTTTLAQTTTSTVATTTTQPPRECPEAPYQMANLPPAVGQGSLDSESFDPEDVWTSVAGSRATLITRDDGTVAIALIRGTLPVIDWPDEKGEVLIDGTRAVVGPHPDGTWVAGWFEEPGERCDLYTMVFYPPWNPSDVEDVLRGMDRVGG